MKSPSRGDSVKEDKYEEPLTKHTLSHKAVPLRRLSNLSVLERDHEPNFYLEAFTTSYPPQDFIYQFNNKYIVYCAKLIFDASFTAGGNLFESPFTLLNS